MCMELHPQWKHQGIGGNEVASSGIVVHLRKPGELGSFRGELQKNIKSETRSAVRCSELPSGK
jgi:hypothetical protein